MLDFSPGYRQASSLPKQGCICRQTATTDSRALIHAAASSLTNHYQGNAAPPKKSPSECYQKYIDTHTLACGINLLASTSLKNIKEVDNKKCWILHWGWVWIFTPKSTSYLVSSLLNSLQWLKCLTLLKKNTQNAIMQIKINWFCCQLQVFYWVMYNKLVCFPARKL